MLARARGAEGDGRGEMADGKCGLRVAAASAVRARLEMRVVSWEIFMSWKMVVVRLASVRVGVCRAALG